MNNTTKDLATNAKEVAAILKLLSNHYRLMIVCTLSGNELTVGDLNKTIELSQSALSQHLAKLRDAEIVATRRDSQTIYYRLANPKIERLLAVLHTEFCNGK
jgi:ArsR family transcriptional regulator